MKGQMNGIIKSSHRGHGAWARGRLQDRWSQTDG